MKSLLFPLLLAIVTCAQRQARPLPPFEQRLEAAKKLQPKAQEAATKKILAEARTVKDLRSETHALWQLGTLYYNLGDRRRALKLFEQALPLARKTRNTRDEAKTLSNMANVLRALGDQQRALELYQKALTLFVKVGDAYGKAGALNGMATVQSNLGQKRKALELYSESLPLYRKVGDPTGQANVLGNMAGAHHDLGDLRKAIDLYGKALTLFRKVGNSDGEADMLNGMAWVQEDLGDKRGALERYGQALSLFRKTENASGKANALNNMAIVHSDLGEKKKALELYSQALPIYRYMGDVEGEANVLNNMASVHNYLGNRRKALELYRQSLPLYHQVDNPNGEAEVLNNMAVVHDDLGDSQKALEFYGQALVLFRNVHNISFEANVLGNLAIVHNRLGNKRRALEFFGQALPLYRKIGSPSGEAAVLNGMASVHDDLGDKQKALELHSRSLILYRKVGDPDGEAVVLNNMAVVHSNLGDKKKALELFGQALPLLQRLGDRSGMASNLVDQSLTLHDLGQSALAVAVRKEAVNLTQSLRTDTSGLDSSLQKIYTESVSNRYRALADWLTDNGRVPEAQQTLTLLKDDEYEQLLRRGPEESRELIALTPVEQTWLNDFLKASEPLGRLGEEERAIMNVPERARTVTQHKRLLAIATELEVANHDFRTFLEGMSERFKVGQPNDNRLDDVAASQSLSRVLAKLPGTAAVYTLVTQDHVRTILCLPNAAAVGQVPAKIAFKDLSKKVLAFRQVLEDPTKDPRPLGAELYDLLIRPIEPELAAGRVGNLVWSLDSVLRYVPLWALYDNKEGKYLVEKYPSTLFTPRSVDRLAEAAPPVKDATGFGVTKEADLKDADGRSIHFPALPGVGAELDTLRAAFDTEPSLDERFTEDALKVGMAKGGILHVATHFRFHPGSEEDSFLLLGGGERLTLEAFKNLRAGCMSAVDLLVLSACETAVGAAGADGSEFEGFALLAQQKGAGAVMATLWPVNDDSTAALMGTFYRLRKEHLDWTKLQCLREAQLAMIRGSVVPPAGWKRRSEPLNAPKSAEAPAWPESEPVYRHPYFWAPFVLIGNWK